MAHWFESHVLVTNCTRQSGGGAEWIGPFGWSSFYNAAWARDFRMESLLAALKGFQRACWNDAVFSFATFGVLRMFICFWYTILYLPCCMYMWLPYIDIPFTVPFLGGFPIRGSKPNLVEREFIRGRNAQLTKLHLTRDLHCTPGVWRCACLLCCFPLSWEDLQRRPAPPEKFSFRLQHEAEVSQSALYLVGQVLVNRNAGSRILAKINAKISAGCIVKLHLCLSFSLHRKTALAFHPSPWYALSVFDRILSWFRNTFRNTPETWLRAACILMRLQGGSMAAACQVACFQTRSTALGSKALNANHMGRVAVVLPLVWAMCFQTCHAPQAGGVAVQSILKKSALVLQAGPLHRPHPQTFYCYIFFQSNVWQQSCPASTPPCPIPAHCWIYRPGRTKDGWARSCWGRAQVCTLPAGSMSSCQGSRDASQCMLWRDIILNRTKACFWMFHEHVKSLC